MTAAPRFAEFSHKAEGPESTPNHSSKVRVRDLDEPSVT